MTPARNDCLAMGKLRGFLTPFVADDDQIAFSALTRANGLYSLG